MSHILEQSDPEVAEILHKEEERQQTKLSLIPSENFFSPAVRAAVGSVFSHKYAEGNIGKRYYEGNQFVDELEQLTITRVKQAFSLPGDWEVNVQALSGSNANLAVYLALLEFDDTIMSMYLPDGGHLSHGWSFEPDEVKRAKETEAGSLVYLGGGRKVNIVSRMFNVVQYKTDPRTRVFDFAAIERLVMEYKPRLIITGGTSYPRDIDYRIVRRMADRVGALYLADIAHEAGLIAAGVLPTPVGIADVVTMTSHKTLRSGRGAIILAHGDLIKKINRAVLPGLQGGPHNHNIAGICVGLGEVLQPEFKNYAQQVVANARRLAEELIEYGFNLVAGGTDKHLLLIDLTNKPLLGKRFARALNYAGLVANANSMPGERRSPADPSALRVGTPWVTTQGMKELEMKQIARWVDQVMIACSPWAELEFDEFDRRVSGLADMARIAREVRTLCAQFPLAVDPQPAGVKQHEELY